MKSKIIKIIPLLMILSSITSYNSFATEDTWIGTGKYINLASSSKNGIANEGIELPIKISANGRYAVFKSAAIRLAEDRTIQTDENIAHIYRKDLKTGEVLRASTDSNGKQPKDHNYSENPNINADGRFVVFESSAVGLVPIENINEKIGHHNIFRKNLITGKIIRVSTNKQGKLENGGSSYPCISDDGRYVAFESGSDNLVENDSNETTDIFRKDLLTGEVVIVSTDQKGKQADNESLRPSISSNGRYVAFESIAENLVPEGSNSSQGRSSQVYRKDLLTGNIIKASTNHIGEEGKDGIMGTEFSMSSSGHYLTFSSATANFMPDSSRSDLFRKDVENGDIVEVSTDSEGNKIKGGDPSINGNGRYIAFSSGARIYRKDVQTGELFLVTINESSKSLTGIMPSISSSGRYIGFESYNADYIPGMIANIQRGFIADMIYNPILPLYNDAENDKTGPEIELTAPYRRNPLLLKVLAKDTGSGLGRVEISNDNENWVIKPANALINWRPTPDSGQKTIYARAIDRAGNTSNAEISFEWDGTPPTLEVIAPKAGKILNGIFKIKARSRDPLRRGISAGFKKMTVFANKKRLKSTKLNKYTFKLNTKKIPHGKRRLTIKAYDKVGNTKVFSRNYYIENKPLSDLAIVYNYRDDITKMWFLRSNKTAFSDPAEWWYSYGIIPDYMGWDWSKIKLLSGQFDRDSTHDIAMFRETDNGESHLYVNFSVDGSFTYNGITPKWRGPRNNWHVAKSKLTKGDYNKDGRDDIALLYDAENRTKLWIFYSNINRNNPLQKPLDDPVLVYDSGTGMWDWNKSKIVSGDFNGDGRDDIAAMYGNYGESRTKLWVFLSKGDGFSAPLNWWDSGTGMWDWNKSKIVSGDFNGDGRDDIAAMYGNYGESRSKLWVFLSDGSNFSDPDNWWDSGTGMWDWNNAHIVSGYFDSDDEEDIAGITNNGKGHSKAWVFLSDKDKFKTPTTWWNGSNGWDWNKMTVLSGNFDGK